MEDRYIDALRRIGQADEAWSQSGHQPVVFHLLHTGGMQSEIDHPAWDSSWATPAEQTIDDLDELGFLRVRPHHDKRRTFDLTILGRERSRQLRNVDQPGVEAQPDGGYSEDDRRRHSETADAELELAVGSFLGRRGSETFTADELADAVQIPKFDVTGALWWLAQARAEGRIEETGGGWRMMGSGPTYHVRVVPTKAVERMSGVLYALDLTETQLLSHFVVPYQEGAPISFNDRTLTAYRKPTIGRLFGSGNEMVESIRKNLALSSHVHSGDEAEELFFEKSVKDVTDTYIDPSEPPLVDASAVVVSAPDPVAVGGDIFIVHGHSRRDEVDLFLRNATGRRPVILAERAAKGRTIIEKFEQESGGSGFAVVLLTADDLGRSKAAPETELAPRARQNVVLELGYFIGRLGRDRAVALYDEGVELPSDYSGVEFISFANDWKLKLIRELKAAGIEIQTENL